MIFAVSGMHIVYKFTIATDNGVNPLGSLCLARVARLLTRRECCAILLFRLSSFNHEATLYTIQDSSAGCQDQY